MLLFLLKFERKSKMKELEKVMEQLEKENAKIEKAQNRLLTQKQNKLKRMVLCQDLVQVKNRGSTS